MGTIFTYKVTETYLVESSGPLLNGQLLSDEGSTHRAIIKAMQLRRDSGCKVYVHLANMKAEETEDSSWAGF